MKKLYLFFASVIFAFGMNACAQSETAMVDNSTVEKTTSDSFIRFNTDQKIEARKISAEHLNLDMKKVFLSSGIEYKNKFYWKIRLRQNGKTEFLFFQSDKKFSNLSKKECRLEPLLELAKG